MNDIESPEDQDFGSIASYIRFICEIDLGRCATSISLRLPCSQIKIKVALIVHMCKTLNLLRTSNHTWTLVRSPWWGSHQVSMSPTKYRTGALRLGNFTVPANSFTNVFPRVSTNTTENPKYRSEVQHLHFRVGVVPAFSPQARIISTLKIGVETKSRALVFVHNRLLAIWL
eukprot:sb/3472126/